MFGTVVLVGILAGLSNAADDLTFLGDWQGQELVAQVIPRGNHQFQVNLLREFDKNAEPLIVVKADSRNGTLRFEQSGWRGTIRDGHFQVTDLNEKTHQLRRVKRLSPTLNARAPKGAVILFDGSGFDHWEPQVRHGTPSNIDWEMDNGCMRVVPTDKESRSGHSLITKKSFEDFVLHLEFRLPLMADKTGQARANGGVTIEDANWYELQILDSYGLEGKDNECGGLYKIAAPRVNMCRPPLQWQTYDIEFHAPRYNDSGDLIRPGAISVKHNGKQIHDAVRLPDSDNAKRRRRDDPDSMRTGRIILHYHKDPIEYRNIWLKVLNG
jgi:hypothetical protein